MFQANGTIGLEKANYIPGLYKILDELIVNAWDQRIRLANENLAMKAKSKKKLAKGAMHELVTRIEMSVNPDTTELMVRNDGDGIDIAMHPEHQVYTVELILSLVGYCAMSGGWTVRELFVHHGFFTLAVIWTLNGDAADRWAPALAVSLLTAANEASLVAHVLGAPDRIAALRRLYGFSIIAALCATEAWCYADAITAAPHLVSTHVPLFAILYHLHLLRMYVRRWARTRTL